MDTSPHPWQRNPSPVDLKIVSGKDLLPYIADLARLRIEVFRQFPYLYDGNPAYEEHYLQTYCSAELAMAALAIDRESGLIVGASTGVPMQYETEECKQPLIDRGFDPARLFYCGESVLLEQFRGRGLYRLFMESREEYACSLGLAMCCFCAVVRPDDHPLRPPGYQPLDAVWKHFGYTPEPSLVTYYSWKDIDQAFETRHQMMFWLKSL